MIVALPEIKPKRQYEKTPLFWPCNSSFSTLSFAQRTLSGNNELTMKSSFSGWQFYRNGERLKLSQVTDLLSSNEQASAYLKSAKSNYTWSQIIGTVGGFLVGYPVGTALGGGEPKWVMAGVGAGLIVATIPLSVSANKHARNALLSYNESIKSTSMHKPSYSLGFTGTGVALTMHF